MPRKTILCIIGLVFGLLAGYLLFSQTNLTTTFSKLILPKKEVIGFLPYWLLDKANRDHLKYLTTLTYFSLTIDNDGKILKLSSPQEEEPGWSALRSGKLDSFFNQAKSKGLSLSLLVFNGDEDSISQLMEDPINHANNLISDVIPIMKKYGFKDLNLDIESAKEASSAAQEKFTQFAQTIKKGLNQAKSGTLTLDVNPTALIKKDLIDLGSIGNTADKFVIMAYDYHYTGSSVTGAVAPFSGAAVTSEYDTQTAVQKALELVPSKKIFLGLPLYGYEWETIDEFPGGATIPGSGLIASNLRAEQLKKTCASCSAQFDPIAQESYLIYKDQETGTYHQIFYPDERSTKSKIDLAKNQDLGGVAFWAFGYDGENILKPLENY